MRWKRDAGGKEVYSLPGVSSGFLCLSVFILPATRQVPKTGLRATQRRNLRAINPSVLNTCAKTPCITPQRFMVFRIPFSQVWNAYDGKRSTLRKTTPYVDAHSVELASR